MTDQNSKNLLDRFRDFMEKCSKKHPVMYEIVISCLLVLVAIPIMTKYIEQSPQIGPNSSAGLITSAHWYPPTTEPATSTTETASRYSSNSTKP